MINFLVINPFSSKSFDVMKKFTPYRPQNPDDPGVQHDPHHPLHGASGQGKEDP